ncbi:hypothetical protein ACFWUW_32580 [Streptomyces sp. NPDC058655]|uniref:hypothetical protein n=1 Tax=Streptomyces sp. NPDC058655 TaxID=3346577 RepID=UPI00365F6BBB
MIAPVSIRRRLSGLRRRQEVVEAAGQRTAWGIVLLAMTIATRCCSSSTSSCRTDPWVA